MSQRRPYSTEVSDDDGRTWTHVPGPAFDTVRTAPDRECWAAGPDEQAAVLTIR